jgi:AraC-like DNA-binding protein
MDALSDVLRVARLSGGIFLDAQLSAPWCIKAQVEPADCRVVLAEPARIVAFHYVVAGRLLLEVDDQPPIELHSDAIVLLPRNEPHTLASQSGLRPISAGRLMQTDPGGGLARIRYGGGGQTTHIVCGFVGTDARHDPLLDSLPSTLVLDLAGRPACEWIATSFRYAAAEFAAVRAGSVTVLAKLSELMLVEAVRCYLDALPADRRGWLAGLRDPVVGRALALIHTQLARAWTAADLAREVSMSRSAFADRFTTLLGVPPMTYLAAWRMQVAAQRLREGHRSVAQVGADVGYQSEAAFARAFKREYSMSPAQWRRHHLALDRDRRPM